MIKRVIAAVFLINLLTATSVQAMDKKSEQPDSVKETSAAIEGLAIGAKAPNFQLNTLTGESVKLSDFRGKKVIINFWATWCPPCKAEMPAMEQFYKTARKDIVILAVNIDPLLNIKDFVNQYKITFPILMDPNDAVNKKYQIVAVPTTYFINREGVIENKIIGSMKLEDMKEFANLN